MRAHQRIPVRVITLLAALAAVAGCRMGKPDFTQASPGDTAIVSQTQEVPVVAPRSYRCERASEPPALEGTRVIALFPGAAEIRSVPTATPSKSRTEVTYDLTLRDPSATRAIIRTGITNRVASGLIP